MKFVVLHSYKMTTEKKPYQYQAPFPPLPAFVYLHPQFVPTFCYPVISHSEPSCSECIYSRYMIPPQFCRHA